MFIFVSISITIGMKSNNKIKIISFLALFFLLFPPLRAGWQHCIECNDAKLPHLLNDTTLMKNVYKNKISVTTDSGENWKNITIGISSYYYGFSFNEKEANEITADKTDLTTIDDSGIISSIEGLSSGQPDEFLSENSTIDNQKDLSAAKVLSYLVKITKYIKYNICSTGGKESVKVSREKLTQGLYNIKFNGSDAVKTFNYYKLETDRGTFKKEWFS
jgi:hypothetical protein